MEGKLVGVNTAILSPSGGSLGVGFAIPSEMVKPIMQSLLKNGKVDRGFLGVTIQPVDGELASALKLPVAEGVLISDVTPNGPAAQAGLQRGDVITKVNGTPVDTTGRLRNLIAAAGSKGRITVDVVRDSKARTVQVQLGAAPVERSAAARAKEPAKSLGGADLRVSPLSPDAREQFEIPSSVQTGVVVTDVNPSSKVAEAGLRPGDVILEVNRVRVTSPDQFATLWKDSKEPKLLLVSREGSAIFIATKR
jgi:serine protease Do